MRYCIAVALMLGFFVLPATVNAREPDLAERYTDEISTLIEGLPDEMQDSFEGAFRNEDGVTHLQDEFEISSVLTRVSTALQNAWPNALRLLVKLFGWILLCGVLAQLKEAHASSQVNAAFSFCTTIAFALTLTDSIGTVLNHAENYVSSLAELSGALAPIAVALTAASGQLTLAAVTNASLMFVFSLLQNVGSVLFLPAVRLSYCLGIVGAVCAEARIDRITKCVRKVFTVSMTFLMLVVSFVIGMQTVLSKSADSFSVRTVKFALGNVIPLIGGALSDAITTVGGSLSLIRSAAGGVCMIALLVLVLPILVELILYRLSLVICQSAAEMLGCEREGKLIGEVHATFGYVLAVVALVSALFIFVITLLMLIGGASV